VNARLDPSHFTIKSVLERFRRLADPLAPILSGGIDMAAALSRLQERFGGR